MPVISSAFPAAQPRRLPGGLPLPGADCADDDAKLVGATAASQRQLDQWHVPVSTGHQGLEVKPDGMLAGATPGRYVIAMREGSRRRQSIRHPCPLPHFARSSHHLGPSWPILAGRPAHQFEPQSVRRVDTPLKLLRR